MPKICDNTSVGVIVRGKQKSLLLIERKKYNFGFALPAGHLDGDASEAALKKELWEEVGLTAIKFKKVLAMELDNPCRREGGTHHFWYIFDVTKWSGFVNPSVDETKQYVWSDNADVAFLARRLEDFAHNLGLDIWNDLAALVVATNESEEWRENPGLEPPWYIILKELRII